MRERSLLLFVRLEADGPGGTRVPAWIEGRKVLCIAGVVASSVRLWLVWGGAGRKAALEIQARLKRLGIKADLERQRHGKSQAEPTTYAALRFDGDEE